MRTGYVDFVDRSRVLGWAADTEAPDEQLDAIVYVDGEYHARIRCNRVRNDLRDAGTWGAGDHGFEHCFIPALSPEVAHRIVVRFADSDQNLLNGEHLIRPISHGAGLRPILIVAPGRSGTTLLMSKLAQYAQIVVADMPPFELRLLSYYATAHRVLTSPADFDRSMHPDHLEGSGYSVGFNPFSHQIYSDLFREKDLFNSYFSNFVSHELLGSFRTMICEFYIRLADQIGKSSAAYFAEKSNSLDPLPVSFARGAFGQIKQIVLVRDPRDIVCSHMSYFKSDKRKAFDEVSKACASMLKIEASQNTDTIFIRYEDMILNYESVLVALSQFLNTKLPLANAHSKEGEIFSSHATSPTATSSIGRWREQLSDMEKRDLGWRVGEFLAKFDYETSDTLMRRDAPEELRSDVAPARARISKF